jgi:hypothetical protein
MAKLLLKQQCRIKTAPRTPMRDGGGRLALLAEIGFVQAMAQPFKLVAQLPGHA